MKDLLWRGYRRAIEQMPHVRPLLEKWRHVERFCPVEHFYSPIANVDELKGRDGKLFGAAPQRLGGIELNVEAQRRLVEELGKFHQELPFTDQPTDGLRYFFDNTFYSYSDAVYLYSIIRHLRPRRIIEVGSGFSSLVMLDTVERFLDWETQCTFIEPSPTRLKERAKSGDFERAKLIAGLAQDVDLAMFDSLSANDILFIDSSHVSKVGSDVNLLYFEVLPRLASGVYVHIHDIFYPFEYPRDWIYGGRSWNEAYLLRAFLQYNAQFEIVCFPSYMEKFAPEDVQRCLPTALKSPGQSIWIRKK